MQWVLGLCENRATAQRTMDELIRTGFAPSSLAVHTHPQGIWSRMGCRPSLIAGRSFAIYRRALIQGRALFIVHTADEHAPRAIAQLRRLNVEAIQCCQAATQTVDPATYRRQDPRLLGIRKGIQAFAALVHNGVNTTAEI